MPSNLQAYRQMADSAALQITGSHESWKAFLQTAVRLYKYPYNEQVMIHAQRPDATACAEYNFWNNQWGRYVRRGSKGIALIDTTGDRPKLKYVFDVSDTGSRENSRSVNLWQMRDEHKDSISAMLERNYDVFGEHGLAEQLEHVAAQLADEYWNEHSRDMLDIVADSFLEEYDDFNIGVQFRNAATVSITYALMSRCGMEPDERFEHEDFLSIFDFNTPSTVAVLGTAVSEINQQVLRQIEVTIRNYEREHIAERSATNERTDLHEEQGLPDSRLGTDRTVGNEPRQVREDAEIVSEGAPPDSVESHDSLGGVVSPSDGDRRDGEPETFADDAGADEDGGDYGEPESLRPDEVDGADEQLQGTGGGNNPERISLQLSLFPSEEEQIALIDEAESVQQTPFAFSFAQADIDHLLRLGSNTDSSRMRIAAEYMKQKPTEEIAEFLRAEFHGGFGLKTDNGNISAWYAEDGIHLARGSGARFVASAQVIPWNEAAERIGVLMEHGQFASNMELDETDSFSRSQLAQSLWYLRHDFAESATGQGYLSTMDDFRGGGFPDETQMLTDALAHPEYRAAITRELEQFLVAYHEDRDLLRFRYHKVDALLKGLQEQSLPWREYSTDMASVPNPGMFITEDEIDAAIAYGSSVEGGKGRLYDYFNAHHTTQDQVTFLKNEYGIGGRSHAVSGSSGSGEEHSGKGIKLTKSGCVPIELSWSNVAKRISDLIRRDRYYTPEEHARNDEIQREKNAVQTLETAPEPQPTVRELFEHYKPIVIAAVSEDMAYRNACGNSDRENAGIECNAAVRRGVLNSGDMELIRLFSDIPEFRNRLHQEVFDETYPKLHELLRPLSQDDIDAALQRWNGDIASKRRVQDYMTDHARDKDTAAWLSREYGGSDSKSLFIIRTGSPEEMELPWAKVQRRIAQLVQEDRFFTEQELDNFEDIDVAAVREALNNPDTQGHVDEMLAQAEQIASESAVPSYERFTLIETDDGYAIWDDIRDEIYVDEEGVSEHFTSEWQAEDYLRQVRQETTDKEADEWLSVEQAKVEPTAQELLPERMEQITEAFEAAGFSYDDINSYGGYLIFLEEGGAQYTFESWDEAAEWIDDVLFDDSERSTAAEHVMHPERFTEPEPTPQTQQQDSFPYSVGDTVYLEDGKAFIIENIGKFDIQMRDPTLLYPIFRAESRENFARLMERYPQPEAAAPIQPQMTTETEAVYPAVENGLPYDIVIERLHIEEPEHTPPIPTITAENFRISDDNLGTGGAKAKFRMNMDAINLLKELEFDGRQATPEEQEILSKYVGWGGLADAFDESKPAWASEYQELYAALSPEEYEAARASTLNAHYTSPTVIRAIYEAVGNMGFQTGNILEPAMGVGNFFGCMPEEMNGSKLYGVELDSITGRIAKQLYPNANITVAGFETTDRRDFFDLAIGNVPFGQYQVNDRAYNKLGFSIHDYFFAKTLDQVRPGGVIAFVTSRYTMDKQSPEVRKYIAQRAEMLGAIRLPNNAFRANAGTDVVSDIIFLQKRDTPITIEPDWVHLGENVDGFGINSYFVEHPEMVLGRQTSESTQYGKQDFTVVPIEGADLAAQLHEAVSHIGGQYAEAELPELGEGEEIDTSIPADPNVKNYSYTVVDGSVYYRENSRMVKPDLNATAVERVKGMVELRDCVQKLISQQMDGFTPDTAIRQTQSELNDLYDSFSAKFGLINSRGNALAFADDSSYYLLCSLEVLDEDNNLARKADMFTKRTIKPHQAVESVDTASEALALSISEKACVDMPYMSRLTGKDEEALATELAGIIFMNPQNERYETSDEYLSGNVREKLILARLALPADPKFAANVTALEAAQPKDLDASEIEVRLGATWIDREYIRQFMFETFEPPYYLRRSIEVNYSQFTAEWNITGKSQPSYSDVNAYMTYGTDRANAYKILEDTLNLRDVRIYDTRTDPDGKERRVLNSKETTLAQQKQQTIREAFQDWIWRDPDRRQELVQKYNEIFNSTRPREYDGRHITFTGMNPEISLREHQLNAVAHILYGGNTLLAHEVGAGKTFEMVAAAMESKRLGLCQKSLFVVPNHLTEQWASEFLRLYPSANILVATKKDFETRNRKKFCARIATGDYDAVIIGHSQFERIPVSKERQERLLQDQIDEITEGLEELKASRAERFTIKSLERTKKSLEVKLKKLQDGSRKDDVITFEQLGADRLYVDEAHSFKNLFLYTKMRNVAGLSTSDAQKSSDMLLKCRYIDEVTDSKGVIFATGTPVSNSMTELYTMMRYLQHDTIQHKGLAHFDCWASTFGETQTAIELAPEGTGYRARTRFAKFFNLPELMNLFKEAADIKTADQLHLPTPTPVYHSVVTQPTEIQKGMVQELSERAAAVHAGTVDATVDNMLRITSDGRKLGLDQRVINPDLPDDPQSKVNQCVDNIYHIWDDGQAEKLTQLVFCDLSTPKNTATRKVAKAAAGNLDSPETHALEAMLDAENEDGSPFTVYDDIREKLVSMGIPREQIAFIHEANTEVRKKELFAKVRSGQVRVLMGSTFKMGAGMNVQDRLVALHDLDCPWRPGDLEQRSGRIIRQGNMNPEVHIYRYVTESTFDAYLWQTVENKQKFISQIMTSKSPVRSCEDIDETALSFAEIKALCAGDVRIKEKMDLDVDVARLKLMKASHQSQQYKLEDNLLRYFPEQIEQCKGFIAGFESDMKTLEAHQHPKDGFAGMEVRGDKLTDKENAGAALVDAFKEVKGLEPLPIGNYRGFAMSLTLEDFGREYVLTLKGEMTHRVSLGKDPRGNLTRIDNALNGMTERLQNVRDRLENLHAQVETAKGELGKPFPPEEELKTKSARLAELNAELNIDDRTPMERMAQDSEIAKSAPHIGQLSRPSVLEKLRNPVSTSQQQKKKSHDLEVR
jgi:N12 class adenine-specific DNA methylase/adenine-specific DNA methylase